MLVLSRKEGESIELIGLGVTIRVESIRGNRIQIGIEAPKSVKVMRSELLIEPDDRAKSA